MKNYQTLDNMRKWKKASLEQERRRKCNCTTYCICSNCFIESFKPFVSAYAEAIKKHY